MAKNTSVAVSSDTAPLERVKDYYPALDISQKRALTSWSRFEEMINLPFIPRTAAADQGILFDIYRMGERTGEIQGEEKEQWVFAVRLRHACDLPMVNSKEVRHFDAGAKALLAMPKAEGLRNLVAMQIAGILAAHQVLPGMTVEQLPSKDPVLNGPIVLRQALTLPEDEMVSIEQEERAALTSSQHTALNA